MKTYRYRWKNKEGEYTGMHDCADAAVIRKLVHRRGGEVLELEIVEERAGNEVKFSDTNLLGPKKETPLGVRFFGWLYLVISAALGLFTAVSAYFIIFGHVPAVIAAGIEGMRFEFEYNHFGLILLAAAFFFSFATALGLFLMRWWGRLAAIITGALTIEIAAMLFIEAGTVEIPFYSVFFYGVIIVLYFSQRRIADYFGGDREQRVRLIRDASILIAAVLVVGAACIYVHTNVGLRSALGFLRPREAVRPSSATRSSGAVGYLSEGVKTLKEARALSKAIAARHNEGSGGATPEGAPQRSVLGSVSKKAAKRSTPFELNGIISADPHAPKAMVNGIFVTVGSEVSGARVVSITRTTVTLRHQNKDIVLTIRGE